MTNPDLLHTQPILFLLKVQLTHIIFQKYLNQRFLTDFYIFQGFIMDADFRNSRYHKLSYPLQY